MGCQKFHKDNDENVEKESIDTNCNNNKNLTRGNKRQKSVRVIYMHL